MDISATFWHRAMPYFIYIKSLLWLVTVPNVNKINHSFPRYRNKHINYQTNIAIITQIWHRANAISYVSATNVIRLLYQI